MIAMLQALVPDEDLARSTHSLEDDESETEAAERLSQALEHLPSMIIGIEEPEIYQHPVRARAFARVLSSLTKDAGVQLIAATHSPYFVRPEQFESVRRVVAGDGGSRAIQTTLTEISDRANCEQESARKTIEQLVPKTFSEGFFADGVVLVEGDTDRVIVEVLAERLGSPLDLIGISVLDTGGKANLHLPYCLLSEFEVPCYVLVDGDGEGAARKYGTNESALLKYKDGTEDYTINRKKYESALISHRSQTEAICQWLPPSTEPTRGTLPASFNQGTLVTEMFCLWNTDIESELEHWPSFVDALKQAGSTLRKRRSWMTCPLMCRHVSMQFALTHGETQIALTRRRPPNVIGCTDRGPLLARYPSTPGTWPSATNTHGGLRSLVYSHASVQPPCLKRDIEQQRL